MSSHNKTTDKDKINKRNYKFAEELSDGREREEFIEQQKQSSKHCGGL